MEKTNKIYCQRARYSHEDDFFLNTWHPIPNHNSLDRIMILLITTIISLSTDQSLFTFKKSKQSTN